MNQMLRQSKKLGIAIVGGVIVLAGIIMIPYPGPGWLVVFSGLAVLATEFKFASTALKYLKKKYDAWKIWLVKQPKIIQFLFLAFTGLVVFVTIWLLNTFGIIDDLLHLDQAWVHSPILGK